MIIKFCVTCSAPLKQYTPTHYRCKNGHDFYNNPSTATAVVLVRDDGAVLYAKRANMPQKGYYDLPGGFVDYGENPEESARRELLEEAGITLGPLELLTVTTSRYLDNIATCDIVYVCHSWEGEPVAADDVESLEWKPLYFMIGDQFAWRDAYQPVYTALDKYLNHHDA